MRPGTMKFIFCFIFATLAHAQLYTYISSNCNCSTPACYTIANPFTVNSQCYQGNVTQISAYANGKSTNVPLELAVCGLCSSIGYDYYYM